MKIYCLLGNHTHLQPTSGDIINEINIYTALSQFAEVYYNDQKFNPKDRKTFGTKPTPIKVPSTKYDLYYVRNNKKLFEKLPHPKLYFCVPFHPTCFEQADAIVTITNAWKKQLAIRNIHYFLTVYNNSLKVPKNIITFNQVLSRDITDLRNDPKTIKYRQQFGGDFIIGHFGRVVKSCYPYNFILALAKIKNKYPNKKIKTIYSGNLKLVPNSPNITIVPKIPHDDVAHAISACDLILYNQKDNQGHFAGSLKVLEAMACGIPVLSCRYDARIDELGKDYQLFCRPILDQTGRTCGINEDDIIEKISYLIDNPNEIRQIGNKLMQRAQYYSLEQSAKRFKQDISQLR